MKRLLPRALVVLTVLVVLGVGGYAGQVWWARQVAPRIGEDYFSIAGRSSMITIGDHTESDDDFARHWCAYQAERLLQVWRSTPWYGRKMTLGLRYCFSEYPSVWATPAVFSETCRASTGATGPDDPDAWEAWFKSHPNLVWDEKQKRLVERKP